MTNAQLRDSAQTGESFCLLFHWLPRDCLQEGQRERVSIFDRSIASQDFPDATISIRMPRQSVGRNTELREPNVADLSPDGSTTTWERHGETGFAPQKGNWIWASVQARHGIRLLCRMRRVEGRHEKNDVRHLWTQARVMISSVPARVLWFEPMF